MPAGETREKIVSRDETETINGAGRRIIVPAGSGVRT
jgi:hypothetical protein